MKVLEAIGKVLAGITVGVFLFALAGVIAALGANVLLRIYEGFGLEVTIISAFTAVGFALGLSAGLEITKGDG